TLGTELSEQTRTYNWHLPCDRDPTAQFINAVPERAHNDEHCYDEEPHRTPQTRVGCPLESFASGLLPKRGAWFLLRDDRLRNAYLQHHGAKPKQCAEQ